MQRLQSRTAEKVKALCRLRDSAKERAETGGFLAEGLRLCRDIAQYLPARELYATEKMLSEHPELILGTILSRAQRIPVKGIQAEDIAAAMVSQFNLTTDDAHYVAHLANGNYLKAIEAISTGDENRFFLEQFKSMMRNSWARNVRGMKEMADVLAGIGRERQKNFLAYCQHLVRENFVYRFQAPELNYMNREEATFSIKFSPFINERNVFDIMEELALAERHITQNVNAKMVFFDLSLRLTVLIKR